MKIIAVIMAPLRWLLSHEAGLFEVLSGFATTGWGMLSMQSFSPADRPASSDVFVGMQYEVTVVALVVGLGQTFAFGLLDRQWNRQWLRFAAAGVSLWLWVNLLVSAVMGGPPVPPTVMALVVMVVGNALLLPRIWHSKHHGER